MAEVEAHVITGDRVQVWSVLSRAQRDGRLVEVPRWWPMPGPGDRVQVLAQLRPPTVAGGPAGGSGSRWERVRPWLVGAAKALAVLAAGAAVASAVWLVVTAVLAVIALVTAVIAWVEAHLVALLVGAVALVLLLLSCLGGSRCGGIHCGGCRG